MIVRTLTNTNPYIKQGVAITFDATVIDRQDNDTPEPTLLFDINDYKCCYVELALADLIDTEDWKNDKSSFLLKKTLPTDVISLKLYRGCDFVADLNNNTLGTVFGTPYFQDNVRVGYIIEWRKVLDVHGTGIYHIEADREILDRNSTLRTHDFRLLPYNEYIADRTIRIKTISSGIVEGGNNYLGVKWEQQVRIRGILTNPQKTFETDNFQDQQRNIIQIQDSIVIDYDLLLEGVPADIGEPLLLDKLLANEIYITDYNLFNYQKYRNISVYPKDISEQKFYSMNVDGHFTLKFTNKKQNIIKRNYI